MRLNFGPTSRNAPTSKQLTDGFRRGVPVRHADQDRSEAHPARRFPGAFLPARPCRNAVGRAPPPEHAIIQEFARFLPYVLRGHSLMPEKLEKLRTAVEELERELHSLGEIDPETRRLLEEARLEIQDALAREEPESLANGPLGSRLERVARRFEASHPTLAGVLERLVNGLAQLGI